MLGALRRDGPWDGVLLAQHGAAVSESYPDADGEVAARVRDLVGPAMPVGMSLDMHGNLTQRMIQSTTVTNVYRTNPHLDARERALDCATLIVRTVRGEIRPVQALEMPPLVINIVKQFTGEEPMRGLVRTATAGRPARDALRQRRRGLPLRRRPGDGDGLPGRPRRRSRGRPRAPPAGSPGAPGSGASRWWGTPPPRKRPCATPPAPPGGRSS